MGPSLHLEDVNPESNSQGVLVPKIKWTHMAEVLYNGLKTKQCLSNYYETAKHGQTSQEPLFVQIPCELQQV